MFYVILHFTSMQLLMALRATLIAALLSLAASSSAIGMELEANPSCDSLLALVTPTCLLEPPEVVSCSNAPYHPLCEDFPGALKAVAAKTQKAAGCEADYEITYRSIYGEPKKSLRYREIDCITHDPL